MHDADYIRANCDIIIAMHKSNFKVKNIHMLIALLSGHYIYMLKHAERNKLDTCCRICRVPYNYTNLFIYRDCECSLVIPGRYPLSDALTADNILFLKFVDKLQLLFCFKKLWRTEGYNISAVTNIVDK